MSKYYIPLSIKLSDKEYNKIKNMKNKNAFVREAINSYQGNTALEVELSKKKMLEEIMDELEKNEADFRKKLIRNQNRQKKVMLTKMKHMHEECEVNLKHIKLNNAQLKLLNCEDDNELSVEKKIIKKLPTLQGVYNSEDGLTYEKLINLAHKIGVTTLELKDWMDENVELLENPDPSSSKYNFRNLTKKHKNNFNQ